MARTRVRLGRIALLLVLLVASVTMIAQSAGGRTEHAGSGGGEVRVVEEGDTLWGIARDLVGPEGDPRPVVQTIRDLNELGTAPILPGAALVLPPG